MNKNYICHWGIKGQKWGIRRYQNEDGTLTPEGKAKYGDDAKGYSEKQYKQDKSVYGSHAANRINKRVIYGTGVLGARSKEADRINSFRKSAKVTGFAGKMVGGALGLIGTAVLLANKSGKHGYLYTGNDTIDALISTSIISGGAAIGSALGKIGGSSLVMLSGGYSPAKQRG